MTEEQIKFCKRLQERASIIRKYSILYTNIWGHLIPKVSRMYAEDRRIRGVE